MPELPISDNTHFLSGASDRDASQSDLGRLGPLCTLIVAGVLSVAAVIIAPNEARAQTFVQGTRAVGMGNAFSAIGTGAEGLYHNPAGIATARLYAVDAAFEFSPANTLLNASIVDSTTNPRLAMGVGYSYLIARNSDVRGHDIRLAASVPAVQDTVSIGLGGRYLILNQGDVEYARGFTLDTGLIVQPTGEFRLGAAAKNLIDVCRKPEVCGGVTPRVIELGAAYGDPTNFTVSADAGTNLSQGENTLTMRVDAGFEYMVQGIVPLRAGYRWRQLTDSHAATFGGGWRSKGLGLDIGVVLPPARPEDFQLSAGFELYFN